MSPQKTFLSIIGPGILVAATFQSVGKARDALLLTLGGILLVKLPVLLLASRFFDLNGIWAAGAVSELILAVVSWVVLRRYQGRMFALEPWAYTS